MRAGAFLLAACVLGACVSPAGTAVPSGTVTPAPSVSPAGPSATPTPRPTPTPSPRIGPAVVQDVKVLVAGLEIPWAIDLAPDGRLFITERAGRVRVATFDGGSAALRAEPWAVVGARQNRQGESGLLGLALDPDFGTNGFVYLYYSYTGPGNTTLNRLVRMRDASGAGVDETVLLDGIPGSANHDGGRVKVGPDGKLYVTTGDAEVPGRAQDPSSPNGKILRLDRDGTVPQDNPIAGSAVWSLGHRNVQGIAFHPDSRALFATEHGPSGLFPLCCNDEVNRIEPGRNYGWPTVVGKAGREGFVDPIVTSGGTDTWAPSGAAFLTRAGPLRGSFVFAALRGQHLHRLVFASPLPDAITVAFEERLLVNQFGRLRDVFELPSGQLLVLTSNRDGRGRVTPEDDRVILVTLG